MAENFKYPHFSEPLTIKVGISGFVPRGVIIHEILHQVFCREGASKKERMLNLLSICFSGENSSDLQHIFIDALTFQVLKSVWDEEFADRIMQIHRKIKSRKRSWELIDRIGTSIFEENVFEVIKRYCQIRNKEIAN